MPIFLNNNMRLLIITQKIDVNDPVLGFFHGWVEEFAKHCEKVTVICLQKGEYHLPGNVQILPLGKEEGVSKLTYLYHFYKYIWRERKNYDTVFVHMNQEYVILGAKSWWLLGKKILLWRNHLKGNFLTDLAVFLSDKVFCTSNQSYTAHFKKTQIMPVGIIIPSGDMPPPIPRSILFLGRISPVKNVKLFIESLIILDNRGIEFTALVEGDPTNEEDEKYLEGLRETSKTLVSKNKLRFRPGKPVDESMQTFSSHSLYVNLTPSGSLDKAIFGAMASHTPVLVVNTYFKEVLPEQLIVNELESGSIARHIEQIFSISDLDISIIRDKYFCYVRDNHGLGLTIESILRF